MKSTTSHSANIHTRIPALIALVITACLFFSVWNGNTVGSLNNKKSNNISNQAIDINRFRRLPVVSGGRLQPIDTFAHNLLLILREKATDFEFESPDGITNISSMVWFMDVVFNANRADNYPIFRIDNQDVLTFLNMSDVKKKYFSFIELLPHHGRINKQTELMSQVNSKMHNAFERSLVRLNNKIILYYRLKNTLYLANSDEAHTEILGAYEVLKAWTHTKETEALAFEVHKRFQLLHDLAYFYPVAIPLNMELNDSPTVKTNAQMTVQWFSVASNYLFAFQHKKEPNYTFAKLNDAYRQTNAADFNATLKAYIDNLSDIKAFPRKVQYEVFFNDVDFFVQSIILYLVALVLTFGSWLFKPIEKSLNKTSFWVLSLAFLLHTLGIVMRMYLQGRPPVTNLYSSAIFVGWAAVLFGLIIERWQKNGVLNLVASFIGFQTLVISRHLAATGDTLEMMQAVLDSNFWLATHVVVITIGYSSSYVAGFIGCFFVIKRIFKPIDGKESRRLMQMVYGVLCVSMLFSFTGTVLGGIWADQSWGRFWGWDPKENGALLIVLWNALLLHLRWSGIAKRTLFMTLVVFSNVVVTFSWFGVNMLSIGLHSYGFMDKTLGGFFLFIISQFFIMSLAGLNEGMVSLFNDKKVVAKSKKNISVKKK